MKNYKKNHFLKTHENIYAKINFSREPFGLPLWNSCGFGAA